MNSVKKMYDELSPILNEIHQWSITNRAYENLKRKKGETVMFNIGDKVWYYNTKAGNLKARIISIEYYSRGVINIQIKITSRKNEYFPAGLILDVGQHELTIR